MSSSHIVITLDSITTQRWDFDEGPELDRFIAVACMENKSVVDFCVLTREKFESYSTGMSLISILRDIGGRKDQAYVPAINLW